MKSRVLKFFLILLLVGGGYFYYRGMLRPDPQKLEDWADNALKEIFPGAVHAPTFKVDLLEGVTIERLKVQGASTDPDYPALWADSVEIRHDPLALAAGVPLLESIVIRGPRISMHELDNDEIKLDFPFEPPTDDGGRAMRPPSIRIEDGTLTLQANEHSKKFRPGYELVLEHFHGEAKPDEHGALRIEGGFTPRGLGLAKNEEITFSGTADPAKGLLDISALWSNLRLTAEVRGILAADLAKELDPSRVAEGPYHIGVRFTRDPDVKAGSVRVAVEFQGKFLTDVVLKHANLGDNKISAQTVEEIKRLLKEIDLKVSISGEDIHIEELTSSLAGGKLRADGSVTDGGKSVDLTITVKGLNLADAAFRRALGPTGDAVFSEFEASGTADATIHLKRDAGGPFTWEAVVEFTDATLKYLGRVDPVRKTPKGLPMHTGFPYAAEHAKGRVHVRPGLVRLEPIEATHGGAKIRIRGEGEKGRDGNPTGTITWGDDGKPTVHLTIDATNILRDKDLEDAVEGSELAGFLDRYSVSGTIDQVLVDVVKAPEDAVCVTEVSIRLEHENFVYAPFPLPMADVSGTVALLRPVLAGGARAREFHFDASGTAAQGKVRIAGDLFETAGKGRVKVTGTGIHLDQAFTKAVLSSEAASGGLGDAWRFLAPGGIADVEADLPVFLDPGPETYRIDLRGASVTLRPDKPLAGSENAAATIEGLRGVVAVTGGEVTFTGVSGTLEGSPVTVSGTMQGGTMGAWDIAIEAKGLKLSAALLGVIEGSSPCGNVFPEGLDVTPGGSLDLFVHLVRTPDPDGLHCNLTAEVTANHADLTVKLGGLPVRVRGNFRAKGDDLDLDDVTAEGERISVRIPKAHFGPKGFEGTLTATLHGVAAGKEILALLPASVRDTLAEITKDRLLETSDLTVVSDASGAATVRGSLGLSARPGAPAGGAPRGTIGFDPLLIGAPEGGPKPKKTLSGLLRLDGLSLDLGPSFSDLVGTVEIRALTLGDEPVGDGVLTVTSGRIGGLAVDGLTAPASWRGSILRVAPIAAGVFGGRLDGEVSIHTKAPVAYEGRIDISGARLDTLKESLGSKGPAYKGTTTAHVEFQSRGPDLRDLTAVGSASIRQGDLGELPAFANIPALFGNLLPKSQRPRFESADLCFTVENEVVYADKLKMTGPFFSMEGFGSLSFGGTIDLTLKPQFIKSLILPGLLQLPGIGDLLGLLREDPLYVVRVSGNISDSKTQLVPLPFLQRRHAAPPPDEYRGPPFDGEPERRIPHLFR